MSRKTTNRAICLGFLASAFVQAAFGAEMRLVLKDDFSAAQLSQWQFRGGGEWAVENGALVQESTRHTAATASVGDETWRDYIVTFRMKRLEAKPDPDSHCGIRVRVHRGKAVYFHTRKSGCTFVGAGAESRPGIRFPRGEWRRFIAVCRGPCIEFYVDGRRVLTSRSCRNLTGGIALMTWCMSAAFDDVRVYRLKPIGSVPRPEAFRNVLRNSSFETASNPGLPDYWGSGHWSVASEPWCRQMDLWHQCWRLAEEGAFHGRRCLRLERRLKLVSVFPETAPGKRYALSLHLRAAKPDTPVRVGIIGFHGPDSHRETFRVGTTWQRYSLLTGELAARSVRVSIEPQVDTAVWVDAAQMEEREAVTTYEPSALDELVARYSDTFDLPTTLGLRHYNLAAVGAFGELRPAVNVPSVGGFFPFGFIWESAISDETLKTLAAHGCNCVMLLPTRYKGGGFRRRLDTAEQLGLRVICWLSATPGDKGMKRAKERVRSFRNHPAIAAWLLFDEPYGRREFTRENIWEALREIKALDPTRPVYINYTIHGQVARTYGLPGDIMSNDWYPVPDREIDTMADYVADLARLARSTGRRAWFFLQVSGYAYSKYREPTPDEQECMTYQALVHGAQGIIYFANRPRCEAHWQRLGQLAKEVRYLAPLLVGAARHVPMKCSDSGVHVCGKRVADRLTVLAVNVSHKTVRTTVRPLSAAFRGVSEATVLFEERKVAVDERLRLEDTFGPYRRHVYEISLEPVAQTP